jgi:hypothetical protein
LNPLSLFLVRILSNLSQINTSSVYLECGLLAEPEESDVVGLPCQTAGSVHAAGLDGLAPDLRHDVALAAKVLVAE